MVLTYNGQASPQGMITLTNVPNILTIQSSSVTGNNSVLKITINDLTKIDPNNTYYITINGLTITSGNVGNNFLLVILTLELIRQLQLILLLSH